MRQPTVPDVREELEHGLAHVGEFIRTQREVARMSVRRLAEVAGVSNPYLSQIERGLRKPSAEILQQIAKALQISVETLYERAGFLKPDSREGCARSHRRRPLVDARATAGAVERVRELRRFPSPLEVSVRRHPATAQDNEGKDTAQQ